MNSARWTRLKSLCILFIALLSVLAANAAAESIDSIGPIRTDSQEILEEKASEEQTAEIKQVSEDVSADEFALLELPEDTTPMMSAKDISITGNTLISSEELLSNIPLVYNSSNLPLSEAPVDSLYDFSAVLEIIAMPGQSRQISARTIRGLTQCILSLYKEDGYSGIYVSVPQETISGGQLQDEILLVKVTEASVSSVSVEYFSPTG